VPVASVGHCIFYWFKKILLCVNSGARQCLVDFKIVCHVSRLPHS
jgi:hypothetical protein